jgi:hypothetical protein
MTVHIYGAKSFFFSAAGTGKAKKKLEVQRLFHLPKGTEVRPKKVPNLGQWDEDVGGNI